MFILKIIIISSTVLNIGFVAAQCNTDQFIEFQCEDSSCKDGNAIGQLRNKYKPKVKIIGFSKDSFLIKNKEILSIVKKTEIHLEYTSLKKYEVKVNIHKTTFDICEPNNQSTKKRPNDLNIAQTSTNIDKQDTIDINNASQFQEYTESTTKSSLNENIRIENFEDKSEDNSTIKNIKTTDDKISNSRNVLNEQNDLQNKINQKNTPKPINPKKLDNDSSMECTLDSCVKDTNIEENMVPDNNLDSKQQPNVYKTIDEHLLIDIKTKNPQKETDNSQTTQNLNGIDLPNESRNIENVNTFSSNQQNHSPSPIFIKKSEIEDNTHNSQKKSDNIQTTQNLNGIDLPSESRNAEKVNTSKSEFSSNQQEHSPSSSTTIISEIEDKTGSSQNESDNNQPTQIFNDSYNTDTMNTFSSNQQEHSPSSSTIIISEIKDKTGSSQNELDNNQTTQISSDSHNADTMNTFSSNQQEHSPSSSTIIISEIEDKTGSSQNESDNNQITQISSNSHNADTMNTFSSNQQEHSLSSSTIIISEIEDKTGSSQNELDNNQTTQIFSDSHNADTMNTFSSNQQEHSPSSSTIIISEIEDKTGSSQNESDNNQTTQISSDSHNADTMNTFSSNQQEHSPLSSTIIISEIEDKIGSSQNESDNNQTTQISGDSHNADTMNTFSSNQQEHSPLSSTIIISEIEDKTGSSQNESDNNKITQNLNEIDLPSETTQNVYINNKEEFNRKQQGSVNKDFLQNIPNADNQNGINSLLASEKNDVEVINEIEELETKNIQKDNWSVDSVIKEKTKQFESTSFIASFGHPDTCSGVNCLRNRRNTLKTIMPSQPLNSVPKQVNQDKTSYSTNIDFEKQNKFNIIDEITTDQSSEELSFSDHIINWISLPILNSIDFLKNMFSDYSSEYNDKYPDQSPEYQKMIGHIEHTNHGNMYFIVMAVVTLLFSLFYYTYQKGTNENNLLTLLAARDHSLLIIEKELSLLKEQCVGNTKSIETISQIEILNENLAKSEDIISNQELRIEKLEQEVEELTESGMEMHALLSSALESSSKNNDKYNTLKEKLVDSQNLVTALTKKNFNITTELEKKNDMLRTLQVTVDELTNKNICLADDNAKISSQKEQILSKNQLRESKLLDEINNLKFELDKQTNALVTLENEVLLSKEALQEVMSQKFNPTDAKKNISTVKLSAELKSAKQIAENYNKKLEESLKSNQEYLDQIDVLKSNIVNLEEKCSQLEVKNEEALYKLNVLTTFFKEQEKEYLKQINEKAILCDNKEGESSYLNERLKSLDQEITNYRLEIQSLKKEIIDQEASFKIQISAETKKANDHWISFRQAERKFKEMELETAQLRNKLTMVDKKLENGTKSVDSSKDFEDELSDIPLPTVSPDFTLLDFEPPPPIFSSTSLQHASVDQRLPPLGALGQTASPPVPLSRRHNRSLSPGSPPPSQRSSLFRPLPQRYNYINRQNSLGHSTESLDK